jgi:FAD linked oxidase domain protein
VVVNKIAQYLNEHTFGDVSVNPDLRKTLSIDKSILTLRPEIVICPYVTGDIRKVAKFTYQLSEKGHNIGVVVRGMGDNRTGSSIGKGIILDTSIHMNHILEFDSKQRLIRIQPGLSCKTLDESMKVQGYYMPSISYSQNGTIGGAVASGVSGNTSSDTNRIADSVKELEVVLANGDVIQTRRYSKREVSKKSAQTDFEGKVYREIETLIEENEGLINQIDKEAYDNSGYNSISKVRQKDGSIDLTPLFVGSQGTLGIISEMIMQVDFYNENKSTIAMTFSSRKALQDTLNDIDKLSPEKVLVIDSKMISVATSHRYSHSIIKQARENNRQIAGILLCTFMDFNDRTRKRKIKKISKLADKMGATTIAIGDDFNSNIEVSAIENLVYSATHFSDAEYIIPPMFAGIHIDKSQLDNFFAALHKLEMQNDINMPYCFDPIQGIFNFYPQFKYRTVQDKRRILAVYDMFCGLVNSCGGSITAIAAEGRLQSPFIIRDMNSELVKLYSKIRDIFDPYKTLNSGVKQLSEMRDIIAMLRQSYSNER